MCVGVCVSVCVCAVLGVLFQSESWYLCCKIHVMVSVNTHLCCVTTYFHASMKAVQWFWGKTFQLKRKSPKMSELRVLQSELCVLQVVGRNSRVQHFESWARPSNWKKQADYPTCVLSCELAGVLQSEHASKKKKKVGGQFYCNKCCNFCYFLTI